MEVRSFGSMAGLSKGVEEHPQLRRRTMLPSREFVRRHEERREVRLALEAREQTGRRDGGPGGGRQSSKEWGIVQRSQPKGPDCIRGRPGRDEFPAVATLHEPEGRIAGPAVNGRIDPEEVLCRERKDRSNHLALFRDKSLAETEKDPKANLRALRATKRSSPVPPEARSRIRAAQNGRVRRGDAQPGTILDFFEESAQERRGRAEGIDVDEIVRVRTQEGDELPLHHISTNPVATKVFADQIHRESRSVIERDLVRACLELHPDAPGSGSREAGEDGTRASWPLREDDRGQIAVHGHRRIVERPRSRSSWTFPTRYIGDEQTRGSFLHVLDGERPIHDRRDACEADIPSS